jgi:SecD/SecF fusion protein
VRAAVAQGYQKGFATIVDANVVTAITAMVLFAVATASVRGFALMLLIGTALSMVTAVLATRAILGLLAGSEWFDNPRLMGATGQGVAQWLRVDFIGRRQIWFAISGTVVALSLVALGARGLNLGIDFQGGTQITFRTPAPTSLETVRSEAAKIGQAGAVIQGRGASTGDRYQNFQIRTESLTVAEQNQLQKGLADAVSATAFGAKNVSESFGRQIARSAILAIVVSLLLIVAYISFRFQWKYSVGVLVALAHDVIITVGVYALTGREVTTATVAAVLTVLGYSIYDTIIIFDRIRENVPLMRRASFRVIGNVSLWEVLPRSLATTFITLLPIMSLYVFGGETLKDFAFALLVGIGSGAYSSIFVAAPLLAMLKEREPEFARRRDDLGALEGVTTVGGALISDSPGDEGPEGGAEPGGQPVRPPRGPAPKPAPAAAGVGDLGASSSKRERRRQRRASRPHGRTR